MPDPASVAQQAVQLLDSLSRCDAYCNCTLRRHERLRVVNLRMITNILTTALHAQAGATWEEATKHYCERHCPRYLDNAIVHQDLCSEFRQQAISCRAPEGS